MTLEFELNGESVRADVGPQTVLREVLRDELDQFGVKVGCLSGRCGVCTVHVDGRAVKSCLTLAHKVDGKSVTTIHGLADEDGTFHDVQQAFDDHFGYQCGYCTPGFLMASADYVENEVDGPEDVTRDEIRHGMKGTICRCTGYEKIIDAVEDAATSQLDD